MLKQLKVNFSEAGLELSAGLMVPEKRGIGSIDLRSIYGRVTDNLTETETGLSTWIVAVDPDEVININGKENRLGNFLGWSEVVPVVPKNIIWGVSIDEYRIHGLRGNLEYPNHPKINQIGYQTIRNFEDFIHPPRKI